MYERLKEEISKSGITVHALALEVKISPNNLYKCIKGESVFHKAYRKKIAEYFNLKESELFLGTEEL